MLRDDVIVALEYFVLLRCASRKRGIMHYRHSVGFPEESYVDKRNTIILNLVLWELA